MEMWRIKPYWIEQCLPIRSSTLRLDLCKLHARPVPGTFEIYGKNLTDPARTWSKNDYPIGKEHGFIDAVSDKYNGLFRLVPDIKKFFLEHIPCLGIECTERFIHEKEDRFKSKRPGNCYPLPHPAGELGREAGPELGKVDEVKIPLCDAVALLFWDPFHLKPECNVVDDVTPREEGIFLEDKTHFRARSRYFLPIEDNRSFPGFIKARDEPEQSRLSASR